jgi:iron complex transport system substrate-binding protein
LKGPFTATLILGLLAACAPPSSRAGAIVVVDDAGDTVHLARPARRVVSLVPATTELLFDIGAGPAVVGRTRWCNYPAEAKAVPDLGDGIRPSVEAIVDRHPDLVVLYRSGQNAGAAARLRDLGIPTVQYAVDRLSDVSRVSGALGTLTGHGAGADSLSRAFTASLDSVSTPDSTGPRILILAWDQPPMTIGAGSFQSELLVRAGGRNLFADLPASSGTVSIEAIASRNPDAVLVTAEGEPQFARRPEWQVVPAVRDHRFVQVRHPAMSRPSPRAPEVIRELHASLRSLAR